VGKQARLRTERREGREAFADPKEQAATTRSQPTEILRELHYRIRCLTCEGPRRSWELMLEILGDRTGVNCQHGGCLTESSKKVLRDLSNLQSTIVAYRESWDAELQTCKEKGRPITDPIGTVLEESGGTPGRPFFTPLERVRGVNAMAHPGSRPRFGLDRCCGSGRVALDALVHLPDLTMFNVDVDPWMARAALLSFRFAQRYTHLRTGPWPDPLLERAYRELFSDALDVTASMEGGLLIPGGRSFVICADSLLVDLECADNWRYSLLWDPPPWQSTMKLAGFDGTYAEWKKARPEREELHTQILSDFPQLGQPNWRPRFDFKIRDLQRLTEHLTNRLVGTDFELTDELNARIPEEPVLVHPVRLSDSDESRLPLLKLFQE
jgi:hypothetical protein